MMARDLMGKIDYLRFGGDLLDDPVAGAHEIVGETEIAQKGYESMFRHDDLSIVILRRAAPKDLNTPHIMQVCYLFYPLMPQL
jgi:hypothetical protein